MLAVSGAVIPAAPIPELAPDQVTQAIGMVKETFFKDLLMQARAVETGRQAEFDIFDQGRRRWALS